MDWTQALTIILSNLGILLVFFVYLMSRMDNKFENLGSRISKMENRLTAIEVEAKNTNQRLSSIETENKDISKRLSNIEGYISPQKVFHFDASHKESESEEPKEN